MLEHKAFIILVLLGAVAVWDFAKAEVEPGTRAARLELEQTLLKKLFNTSTYASHVAPPGKDTESVQVAVDFYLRSIYEIDDHNQEMSFHVTLRQRWNDPRLTYSVKGYESLKFLSIHDLTQIWRPDIFVSNSKVETAHGYDKPNVYIRVSPNGDVLLSERLTFTTYCDMDLTNHPFDTQSCVLRLASYGYIAAEVAVNWKDTDPVQVSNNLNLRHFTLLSFTTDNCDAKTNTGIYSCIKATFNFKRNSGHYFSQVFIPLTMFVIIGYLTFWVEPQNLMARLGISLSTLYFASSQVSELNSDLPKGPYKVLDTFTGACLTFIFITVIETVVVYNLYKKETLQARLRNPGRRHPETDEMELEDEPSNGFQLRANSFNWRNARDYLTAIPKMSQKIDVIMIAGYPLTFFVFTLLYFFYVVV